VFSAYGVAGIVGPLLAGVFKDAAATASTPIGWMTPFMIAGVSCLVGGLLMLFTSRPTEQAKSGRGRGRGGVAYGNA
jgi:MFS family permease